MGHSVEGRVPFLDHRLIELAAAIPPKFKIRGLDEKHVLKRAFADVLPAEITNRPKKPYRAPIAACFLPGNANLGAELIEPDQIAKAGFANATAVGKLLHRAASAGDTGAGALSERDEMAVAVVVSLQILQHQYVTNFRLSHGNAAA